MEKYSKAVSEMYSQFKEREAHPMEKYIGKHVVYRGETLEVVGYATGFDGSCCLIAGSSQIGGWTYLGTDDVIFKDCKSYWYVGINDLID